MKKPTTKNMMPKNSLGKRLIKLLLLYQLILLTVKEALPKMQVKSPDLMSVGLSMNLQPLL